MVEGKAIATAVYNLRKYFPSGDLTKLLENVIPRLANDDFVQFVDKFHENMVKFFLVSNYNYFNKGIKNSLDSLTNNVIIPK